MSSEEKEYKRFQKQQLKEEREQRKVNKMEVMRERNPCYEEKMLSRQCIIDDNYRHRETGNCWEFFENYNQCNKFWLRVKWHRWWNGEYPYTPPPEERDMVRDQYKHLLKKYRDRKWDFEVKQ